mmetsp:Transcript_40544/g.106457  ORF Transcript_40544/g.106457 Transcript_40544/m.106457 type:complete len:313 (+) Transcript_40544:634-1572(+)
MPHLVLRTVHEAIKFLPVNVPGPIRVRSDKDISKGLDRSVAQVLLLGAFGGLLLLPVDHHVLADHPGHDAHEGPGGVGVEQGEDRLQVGHRVVHGTNLLQIPQAHHAEQRKHRVQHRIEMVHGFLQIHRDILGGLEQALANNAGTHDAGGVQGDDHDHYHPSDALEGGEHPNSEVVQGPNHLDQAEDANHAEQAHDTEKDDETGGMVVAAIFTLHPLLFQLHHGVDNREQPLVPDPAGHNTTVEPVPAKLLLVSEKRPPRPVPLHSCQQLKHEESQQHLLHIPPQRRLDIRLQPDHHRVGQDHQGSYRLKPG